MSNLTITSLQALLLVGGRSTRMGEDKSRLHWHGLPQREYLADLLESMGLETWISCRPEQVSEMGHRKTLPDAFPDLGPFAGILTAFQAQPDAAWFVVACDLPLLDRETLQHLIENRDPRAAGTAFRAPAFNDGSPDPLAAIWEPKIYPLLQQWQTEGLRCPRKALLRAGVHLVEPPRPEVLRNANTSEEAAALRALLGAG